MNSKNALIKLSNMTSPYYWRTKEQIELIKIVEQSLDQLEKLEKENQELKNTILSLELDTCIPELRKENTKLKKVIEMLKTKLDIEMYEMHKNGVTKYYLDCSAGEVIDEQEEYTLIREVLEND